MTLAYRITLADGTPVDAAGSDDPFTFEMGTDALPAGIQSRLLGLRPGDERSFAVPAVEAWGARDADTVRSIPRSDLPADWPVAPDLAVTFSLPDGSEVAATIVACEGDTVDVDFSHPLAGYDIVITVTILSVGPSGPMA
ncbi:MAG: FKBP-type peptidyl-prolyl cis-trans isomerase [Acidobacteriaceae bacterium]